ncbi:Spectrin beta chain [Schistosoma japonicum]|nr:Spectrin beta chain [Schistosoma japonicum]
MHNVIHLIQLTKDDDNYGVSFVENIQQFNRIQEYNKIKLTDLEKYPLIRRYKEISVTMPNMHEQTNITNVTLINYYQSNKQVVYSQKIIELINLSQRHRNKLLNENKKSIVTDVLARQKPFTVDKEDDINSILRQTDHYLLDSFNHNHLLVADVMTIRCDNTQSSLSTSVLIKAYMSSSLLSDTNNAFLLLYSRLTLLRFVNANLLDELVCDRTTMRLADSVISNYWIGCNDHRRDWRRTCKECTLTIITPVVVSAISSKCLSSSSSYLHEHLDNY